MPDVTVTDTRDDCRLWLMSAARTPIKLLLHWKDLSVDLGLFGAGTLTVTLHKDQLAGLSNGADDVLLTDFGWTGTVGLCSIDYYQRGTRVFSGPIQTVVCNRDGNEGNAWVSLTCETWGPALLRRRQVRTELGNPWTDSSESWHDIGIRLIAEQSKVGTVVTPTGWQQNSEVRSDFGAFTVTTGAETGSGSETFTVENRTNLWDAVCELCNTPASDANKLWPTWTESPAATFTFDFVSGRTGGSRAIGSDKTATVVFASPRRTVPSFSMTRDGAATGNHLVSGGKGPGTGQSTRHAADDTTITTRNLGVYEDAYDVPGGRVNAELDAELVRALQERKSVTTWTAKVVESTGNVWPTDFGICDSVTIYDEAFRQTVANMIIGIKLTYPAPGPYVLELIFGQPPRNDLRNMARSGGGGGGGRGGGGRSKNHDGTRYVYDHVDGNSGTCTAHEAQTGLDIIGVAQSTDVRAYVTCSDELADGTDDETLIEIVGDFFLGGLTQTGYVTIKTTTGSTIRLHATLAPP
jgi:hypothetical protein